MSTDNPVIFADSASKLFLDGTVVAFRELSLDIWRDEIMCIVERAVAVKPRCCAASPA